VQGAIGRHLAGPRRQNRSLRGHVRWRRWPYLRRAAALSEVSSPKPYTL